MTSIYYFLQQKRNMFFSAAILMAFIMAPNDSFAQAGQLDLNMPKASSSKSSVAGGTVDMRSFGNLKRIRAMINKGDNEKASHRLITIIRQEESKRRDGLKSDLLAVAYNELCLASTNLRKIEYAMEACNTSLSMTPDHWESLKNRATLNYITQNFEQALSDFKLSLENAPENEALATALKQNISVAEGKIQ